jgi:serine/threonine-protein kinase
MDRHVALKILLPHMARDPGFLRRFRREAKLWAKLQHPHILPVFDFGTADAYAYIVMPLVETGTLADILDGEPLPLSQICRVISQVGDALDHAHSLGVIHRDVKPSNVLVDHGGNCLLTDFGVAKIAGGSAATTQSGAIIGTPAYMSPEQIRAEELDGRSDLYSLGVVLYQMATGRVPYQADAPSSVFIKHLTEPLPPPRGHNPNLPAGVEKVITRSLSKEREGRYPTAGEMAAALAEAVANQMAGAAGSDVLRAPAVRPALWRLLHLRITSLLRRRRRLPMRAWELALIGIAGVVVLAVASGVIPGSQVPATQPPPTTRPAVTTTAVPANTHVPPTPSPTYTPVPPTPLPTATPTPLPTVTPTQAAGGRPAHSPPGHIVFTCFMGGNDEICSIGADGAGEQRLTDNAATDWYASYSADGSQIVFSSRRRGRFEFYLMETDGSNQRPLGADLGDVFASSLSPDGRHIAFTSARHGNQDIWVANSDGSGPRRLTNPDHSDIDPVWSPDGTQIAFCSDRSGRNAHYVMNSDGSDVRALVTGLRHIGGRSDWSPDGRWLAFYTGPGEDRDIYLVATDGSEVRRLTDGGNNVAPSFSPDGEWIAFMSTRDGDSEIFVMRVDGTDIIQLTDNERPDWQPRWGP